jgi:hypothetical protein
MVAVVFDARGRERGTVALDGFTAWRVAALDALRKVYGRAADTGRIPDGARVFILDVDAGGFADWADLARTAYRADYTARQLGA